MAMHWPGVNMSQRAAKEVSWGLQSKQASWQRVMMALLTGV